MLKADFINKTLEKIQKVMNLILSHYDVKMEYNINERNKLFCEIIKRKEKDLTTSEMFNKIQKILYTNENLTTEQSEWLSQQIYDYHRDIFLLHYFYAILYSYNHDFQIREKVTEEHVKKFFYKANEIYKKYKNLVDDKVKIKD